MVVGGCGEQVAERVEGHGPDVGVVCLGERGARRRGGLLERWFRGGEVPVEEGAFGAARDQEVVVWVPCYRCS